jgi:hypothetical protein
MSESNNQKKGRKKKEKRKKKHIPTLHKLDGNIILTHNVCILSITWNLFYTCMFPNKQKLKMQKVFLSPERSNSGGRVEYNFCSVDSVHQPVQRMVPPVANIHCDLPCRQTTTNNTTLKPVNSKPLNSTKLVSSTFHLGPDLRSSMIMSLALHKANPCK